MKNITLSAEEAQIERARHIARERHTSLNQLFRDWLDGLDNRQTQAKEHVKFVREHSGRHHVGGPYSRDEFNER